VGGHEALCYSEVCCEKQASPLGSIWRGLGGDDSACAKRQRSYPDRWSGGHGLIDDWARRFMNEPGNCSAVMPECFCRASRPPRLDRGWIPA